MQPANVLHIPTLYAGWCDKDHVMLHACFQLLTDFVEQEMRVNSFPDWEADEESRSAKTEIDFLYDWWQKRKKDPTIDRVETEETYLNDNIMLKRLIDIRMHLWT